MGWTSFSMHRPVKEWFKEHIEGGVFQYRVLDSAIVKRNTLYAAIEIVETKEVICSIYMLSWSRNPWDNFSYKSMDEFAGPVQSECPERIFKLLTPLSEITSIEGECIVWAERWRDRVQKLHAKRKELSKAGNCIVQLDEPIKFTNGTECSFIRKEGRSLYALSEKSKGEFYQLFKASINLNSYSYKFVEKNLPKTKQSIFA